MDYEIGWQASRNTEANDPAEAYRKYFATIPTSSLKESTQNSMDALIGYEDNKEDLKSKTLISFNSSDSVEVTFQLIELSGKAKKEYLENIDFHNSLSKYLHNLTNSLDTVVSEEGRVRSSSMRESEGIKALLEDIEDVQKPIHIMNIIDKNTHGLLGLDEARSGDKQKNFFGLLHSIFGSKKAVGGGSWNLGKTSYTEISKLKMFITRSNMSIPIEVDKVKKQYGRIYGVALTTPASLDIDDETDLTVSGVWTFGVHPKEDNEFPVKQKNLSIWDEDDLSKKLILDTHTNKEYGTTIQIPFLKNFDESDEIDLRKYGEKILKDCYTWLWPAIISNRMKVEVKFTKISDTNSKVSFEKINFEDIELDDYVKNCIDVFTLRRNEILSDSNESIFENRYQESNNYFKVPVEIKLDSKKGRNRNLKKINYMPETLIKVEPSAGDEVNQANTLAFVRGIGIVVKYERVKPSRNDLYFHGAMFTGTCFYNEKLDVLAEEYLRLCETPSHNDWWGEINQLREWFNPDVPNAQFEGHTEAGRSKNLTIKQNILQPLKTAIIDFFKIEDVESGEDDPYSSRDFEINVGGDKKEKEYKTEFTPKDRNNLSNEILCKVTVPAKTMLILNTKSIKTFKDPDIKGSEVEILSITKSTPKTTVILDAKYLESNKNDFELVTEKFLQDNKEELEAEGINFHIGDIFHKATWQRFQRNDVIFNNQKDNDETQEVIFELSNNTKSGMIISWEGMALSVNSSLYKFDPKKKKRTLVITQDEVLSEEE
jgi:hypothetical protein